MVKLVGRIYRRSRRILSGFLLFLKITIFWLADIIQKSIIFKNHDFFGQTDNVQLEDVAIYNL